MDLDGPPQEGSVVGMPTICIISMAISSSVPDFGNSKLYVSLLELCGSKAEPLGYMYALLRKLEPSGSFD